MNGLRNIIAILNNSILKVLGVNGKIEYVISKKKKILLRIKKLLKKRINHQILKGLII